MWPRSRYRRQGVSRRDASGGFTLVEMLVVLVILSLVLGLVGPRVLNYLSDARTRSARLQIESFAAALDLFYLDTGRYPTTAEGLNVLVRPATGTERWNGPYLRSVEVPPDPWGNRYLYRAPGDKRAYEITSLGSDGRKAGTGDAADISND